jgi:hypothetical protein
MLRMWVGSVALSTVDRKYGTDTQERRYFKIKLIQSFVVNPG